MKIALVAALSSLAAVARPVLQPEVKEYRALGGEPFAVGNVVCQSQRQCEIAAKEFSGISSNSSNPSNSSNHLFIAIADSEMGRTLAREFALDVPAKEQGYAIKAVDGKVAVVGHDAFGALYGAVTFAQMNAEGKVAPAVVRDWPDVRSRGGVSIGRGLWKWTEGEKGPAVAKALKAGIDELVRHKFNGVFDIFRVHVASSDSAFAVWRDVLPYAVERGVTIEIGAGTYLWSNHNVPKGMTPKKWPCVTGCRAWGDHYYCWADDDEIAASANRCIDFIEKLGIDDPKVDIHPVDASGLGDPECWSHRCAKCRARWADDERWKASANLFNIWSREFRRRMPKARLGSPVVPYHISHMGRAPEAQDAKWKLNARDYWINLDRALDDPDFYFCTWAATKKALAEFRKIVPKRPLDYGDVYPTAPGLFYTCRRKAGTLCEPGSRNCYHITGTDSYANWESVLLAAEYAWNAQAEGAEDFDGVNYAHPLADTTGPAVVMTNLLPRICRTFWGKELAPYMTEVMRSGVLPTYLENPMRTVADWNRSLRNPDYDPQNPNATKARGDVPVVVDSLELMRSQLVAAETCARTLTAATAVTNTLDRYKIKYFRHLHGGSSRWVDLARMHCAVREADEAAAVKDFAKALSIVSAALEKVSDAKCREKLERLQFILAAKPTDGGVPSADAVPMPSKLRNEWPWRKCETWSGEKVISEPMVLNREQISIKPGTKIRFTGKGALVVKDGIFRADGVEFSAEGVLTNAYRLAVNGGICEIANCAFRDLRTQDPGRRHYYYGSICLSGGAHVQVEGCRFENSDCLALHNITGARIAGNVFDLVDRGVYCLNSHEIRIEHNLFRGVTVNDGAVKFSASARSEVVHNRFEQSGWSVLCYSGADSVKIAGNVYRDAKTKVRFVTKGQKTPWLLD